MQFFQESRTDFNKRNLKLLLISESKINLTCSDKFLYVSVNSEENLKLVKFCVPDRMKDPTSEVLVVSFVGHQLICFSLA